MIRAHELIGRAVVDMDAAEKLGNVKGIIVSQGGERVAGFVVARGESIFGGGVNRNIPASAVHVIGPDAITVSGAAAGQGTSELASLPRVSDVMGRKMVSRSGRLLGSISDVLINPDDGTIVGFALGEGTKSKIENLFGAEKKGATGYVRADADLQVGRDLIVVPDDALVQPEIHEEAPMAPSSESSAVASDSAASQPARPDSLSRWGAGGPSSDRRNVWTTRDRVVETPAAPRPATPVSEVPPPSLPREE